MFVCKTCGKPVRFKWGSHGTSENHMKIIHDSERCYKLIIVKVREIVSFVEKQSVVDDTN